MNKVTGIITIGGSDSSGGAGIQADNRILGAFGTYPFTVITAVTSQNSKSFYQMERMDPSLITSQIRSIYEGYKEILKGIKISFLPGLDIARAVFDSITILKENNPQILVMLDPIIATSTGKKIITPECLDFIKEKLLGLVDVITPNYGEGCLLFPQLKNVVFDDITKDGGCNIKPSFFEGYTGDLALTGVPANGRIIDIGITQKKTYIIEGNNKKYRGFHGSGCFYSSCLIASLIGGTSLEDGMKQAKAYLEAALEKHETENAPYYYLSKPVLINPAEDGDV